MSIESDIERVYDFLLDSGSFDGTSWDLSDAIGIPYDHLWAALHKIRSAEFIADSRWTIPNVPKGAGPKTWSIVDESDDEEVLRDGFKVRAPEVIETMRRLQAQSALATGMFDPNTAEGVWWAMVNATAASIVSTGEIMVRQVVPSSTSVTSE